MGEQWTEKERLSFCKQTSDYVMEALDTAWHDGMKIGKEHQAGFQSKIAELEAANLEYEKTTGFVKTINKLMDENSRLLAKNKELEATIEQNNVALLQAVVSKKKHTALENGLRDVGEVHDSWNASDEFKKGWAACREQFRALLDSINNPDSDSKVSTLIDQEND